MSNTRNKIIACALLIIALAVATRLYLAVNVRTCLGGDELPVGIMAYRIEDRGEHPIFFYGVNRNGGGSIEAHATAALNSVFGRSVLNVQLPVILSFAVYVGVTMLLGMRSIGVAPGLLAGLQVALCPQFYRSSMLAIGYMEILTVMVVCCYIVYARMMGAPGAAQERKPPSPAWGALLGLLTGVAFWGGEYSAMMTAALFAAYAIRWRKRALPALLCWTACFPAGAFPMILYNARTGFYNFRHLVGKDPAYRVSTMPAADFFTKDLPSLFQNDFDRSQMGLSLADIPWSAWLLFAATAAACIIAALLSARGRGKTFRGSGILAFGLAYCAFYCAMYLASPFRGDATRYLLPLEPFLTIGLAAGVTALVRARGAAARLLAAVLIAMAVAADAGGAAYALKDNTVDFVHRWDVACDEITGQIDRLEEILKQRGILHVYTTGDLKRMILFQTEERITAADATLPSRVMEWTDYEDAVLNSDRQMFFFNEKDQRVAWLRAYLRANEIPYYFSSLDYFVLIQPERDVSHVEFIEWCRRAHEARSKSAPGGGEAE